MFDFPWLLRDPANWVQFFCAAFFAYCLLDNPKKDRSKLWRSLGKVLFLFGVFLLTDLVLNALSHRFFILAGVGSWLSYLFGILLYAAIFPKYDWSARIVTGAAAFSIIITAFRLGAVFGRLLEFSQWHFNSLYSKLAASLALVLVGWFLRNYRIYKYHVSVHAVRLNLATCIASAACVTVYDTFSVHVFGMTSGSGIPGLMSAILLALCVIDILVYLMTYHLCREYTNVADLTAETQMNKSAASLMAVTSENLAELHKIQHDINNQYAYMRAMLDTGDLAGLKNYLDELSSTFSEPIVPLVDCGNHTLDLILNMETSKARSQGVTLDVNAVPPHELPFSELDLVKLYTNVIDNAIEACVSEQPEDPTVTVSIRATEDYLLTKVRNPTRKGSGILEKGFPTTKGDRTLHGKGTGIVRSIVKKHGGSIRYNIQDGHFLVEFILDLKGESDHA